RRKIRAAHPLRRSWRKRRRSRTIRRARLRSRHRGAGPRGVRSREKRGGHNDMTQDSVLNEENKKVNAAKPAPERPKRVNTGLKLVLEFGPLALFFVANHKYGIYAATGALMVGVLAALGVAWSITRRLPMMPVVTAILLLIFGGLTFLLQDETFIKM